jgi:hypothetical protein
VKKKKTQTKIPKLSEAIRQGIKMDGRKITGQYFVLDRKTGEIAGCCALGAAALGFAGVKVEELRQEGLKAAKESYSFDDMKPTVKPAYMTAIIEEAEIYLNDAVDNVLSTHPDYETMLTDPDIPKLKSGKYSLQGCTNHLGSVVPYLNDTKGWSRQKIADFLEKLGL